MSFDEIKQALSLVDSPVEKLEMLMDFGKTLQPVPENAKCTEIVGCTSFIEICRQNNNFFAQADSAIVRGIAAIVIALVDGKSPSQIKKIDLLAEFNSLNLNLGASRLNGLNSMVRFLQNL